MARKSAALSIVTDPVETDRAARDPDDATHDATHADGGAHDEGGSPVVDDAADEAIGRLGFVIHVMDLQQTLERDGHDFDGWDRAIIREQLEHVVTLLEQARGKAGA